MAAGRTLLMTHGYACECEASYVGDLSLYPVTVGQRAPAPGRSRPPIPTAGRSGRTRRRPRRSRDCCRHRHRRPAAVGAMATQLPPLARATPNWRWERTGAPQRYRRRAGRAGAGRARPARRSEEAGGGTLLAAVKACEMPPRNTRKRTSGGRTPTSARRETPTRRCSMGMDN